jgi:hypothetical protein
MILAINIKKTGFILTNPVIELAVAVLLHAIVASADIVINIRRNKE